MPLFVEAAEPDLRTWFEHIVGTRINHVIPVSWRRDTRPAGRFEQEMIHGLKDRLFLLKYSSLPLFQYNIHGVGHPSA